MRQQLVRGLWWMNILEVNSDLNDLNLIQANLPSCMQIEGLHPMTAVSQTIDSVDYTINAQTNFYSKLTLKVLE